MFSKEIENMDINDIQWLKENEIPESSYLDYKEQMINNKKLAKLMIAFANSSGGFVFIGIKEKRNERNKKTGLPEEILGINAEEFSTKITDIARSYSQPIIIPNIKPIPINSQEEKVVLAIKIKESLEPIMFYSGRGHKWNNKWFVRINDKIMAADYNLMKKLFYKEAYAKETRIQRLYSNIKDLLNKIKIEEITTGPNKNETNYNFVLRQSWGHNGSDTARLSQFQKKLNFLLKLFEGDLQYLGIRIDDGISILGKYKILSRLIRCPSYHAYNNTNLIDNILEDIKDFSKTWFSIDLK